jgi:hypothetical protein
MKKLAFLLLVTVMLLSMAGTSSAILNGEPDGGRHPYVGIAIQPAEGGGYWVCSASALSNTVVLTASHCFEPGITVSVSFTEGSPRKWIDGTVYNHPGWCIGCAPGLPGFDTHDVAVIVLENSDKARLPEYVNLPSQGLVDSLPQNQPVSLVGYGVQWIERGGGPPEGASSYTRYYAPTELVQANFVHSDEFIRLRANPSQGTGSTCFGDSGGPDILEGNGVGNDVVLAVNSYVTNGNCAGVTYSNRVDTAYALEFIRGFLNGNGNGRNK